MRSGAGTRCLSVTASSAYGDPYLLRLAAGYRRFERTCLRRSRLSCIKGLAEHVREPVMPPRRQSVDGLPFSSDQPSELDTQNARHEKISRS